MLNIYTPAVLEGYEWVVPSKDSDHEIFLQLAGVRTLTSWSPVKVRLVKEDTHSDALRQSDFPWLGAHALVLRRAAMEALAGPLAQEVEFLPLDCTETDLWVMNALRVVDALDEARSAVVRFSGGRIMKIDQHAFDARRLEGVSVFKIPQMLRGSQFLSQAFVDLVETSGLRGIGFKLVWAGTADGGSDGA
jgi:hypothetical protein